MECKAEIEKIKAIIREYTKEEFTETEEPYSFAYQFDENKFELEQVLNKLSAQCSKYNIRNFKTLYKAYSKEKKQKNNVCTGNITNYTGQYKELRTADWVADDSGVSCYDSYGVEQWACRHPITIKERLTNIDTGVEKLKISFARGFKWRDIIVDKKNIASANKITDLSDQGISVTSETSKLLVRFLHDLENENYEEITEKKCCSRLGWIEDEGFAPYNDELTFDGDVNLSGVFKSVKSKGDYDKWKAEIINVCNFHYINKIVLGASFAAPLIKILGVNNFFLHLWAETETAKTVSTMCAASVWADPLIGKYIQTFNSTNVGKERIAEVCNNLPVFFDELQIVADRTQFDREIYELTEGAGRLRGNKIGGTDKTATWQTCFITTGEKPITSENSQGGAVNRIIEIEVAEKLIPDGKLTCDVIKKNYGHAGRIYIESLNEDKIKALFVKNYKELEESAKTEKQTSIGAIIVTAFNWAAEHLFGDCLRLELSEVSEFLSNKNQVSVHEKAYSYTIDFLIRNASKFKNDSQETFGRIIEDQAYIIKSVFDKMLEEGGYNATAFTSWLIKNQKCYFDKGRKTVLKKINGVNTRCMAIKVDTEEIFPF